MVTVEYPHQFSYREMVEGRSPVLLVTISRLNGADDAIDVDAYIDSGTSTSLFNGFLLTQLGLDLMNDKKRCSNQPLGVPLKRISTVFG